MNVYFCFNIIVMFWNGGQQFENDQQFPHLPFLILILITSASKKCDIIMHDQLPSLKKTEFFIKGFFLHKKSSCIVWTPLCQENHEKCLES